MCPGSAAAGSAQNPRQVHRLGRAGPGWVLALCFAVRLPTSGELLRYHLLLSSIAHCVVVRGEILCVVAVLHTRSLLAQLPLRRHLPPVGQRVLHVLGALFVVLSGAAIYSAPLFCRIDVDVQPIERTPLRLDLAAKLVACRALVEQGLQLLQVSSRILHQTTRPSSRNTPRRWRLRTGAGVPAAENPLHPRPAALSRAKRCGAQRQAQCRRAMRSKRRSSLQVRVPIHTPRRLRHREDIRSQYVHRAGQLWCNTRSRSDESMG
eukprot:scaffold2342_cov368-Pinguiococcus_pyrenoidosus.AAC.7